MESGEQIQPLEGEPMKDPEVLAERARVIRGNRHGPKSWQMAIFKALDEVGAEQEERYTLFAEVAKLVGTSDDKVPTSKPLSPPGVQAEADKRHMGTWEWKQEHGQD